jgi:hypothetical protein
MIENAIITPMHTRLNSLDPAIVLVAALLCRLTVNSFSLTTVAIGQTFFSE